MRGRSSSSSKSYNDGKSFKPAIGQLDPSFDSDGIVTTTIGSGEDRAQAIALQHDGKILVAGYSNINNNQDFTVVRYNSDGSLDTSFDSDGVVTTDIGDDDSAQAIALQPDGKIVVAGYTHNGSSYDDFAVVRYNSDGSLDSSFGSGGKVTTDNTDIGTSTTDYAYAIALQPDGKIVVAGFTYNGSNTDFAVVRYR